MEKVPLIVKIYRTIQAMNNCLKSGNTEWFHKHEDTLDSLSKYLPSGSGLNYACSINIDESDENKIVIDFLYSHCNEFGWTVGYTAHKLICKPTFDGLDLRITGKDKNGVKEYLYDIFDSCLNHTLV